MDSEGPIEVALSTDLRSAPYNFSLWDIYTGSQVVVFKGTTNNVVPNCLQLIDNNYFITANDNVLHIWSIFNRKSQEQKLFLPGRPSVICISPCRNYLSVGISEMIYIWQLNSGNLLAHVQRHYQTVTVLKMNSEGSFLISGGEDGIVMVWPFADLISSTHHTGALRLDKSRKDVGVNEPKYTWQLHDAPVTDIHITNDRLCITSSADKTINVYSYTEGKRLYSVILPTPIWSVVMNKNETKIFLGGQDGNIYEIATSSMSISVANSKSGDNDTIEPVFRGHKGKIVKLLVSVDGSRLVSASIDSTCKIWDIYQRKMLIEVKHQAALANLTSLIVPNALALSNMTQSNTKPSLAIKQLKRSVHKLSRDACIVSDELFEEASTTIIYMKNNMDFWKFDKELNDENNITSKDQLVTHNNDRRSETKANKSLGFDPNDSREETIIELKDKIKELYMISVTKIFQDAAEDHLDPFKQIVDGIREIDETCNKRKKKRRKRIVKQKDAQDADESSANINEESFIEDESNVKVTKKLKRTSDNDDNINSHSLQLQQSDHQHSKFLS